MQRMVVIYHDDGYQLNMFIPMERWKWPNPLVLGAKGLKYDEIKTAINGFLLENKTLLKIPVIRKKAKNITDEVYKEPEE